MSKSKLAVLTATAAALASVSLPTTEAHALQFVPCSATALRNAITLANNVPGPEVLVLSFGCTYTLTAADNPGNGLPQVTSQINITGNGATIRRQQTPPAPSFPIPVTDFRIFQVSGPNGRLTLNNLTVRDGRSTSSGDGGGGIFVGAGSALTLNSVEVTRNAAGVTGPGGGIQNYGTLTLNNSTVSYNFAQDEGGGIGSEGTATISNSTITGNTSRNGGGGMAATGSLTFTNSRLTDNATHDWGGGLVARNLTGTLTDALVRGNSAIQTGGSPDGGGIRTSGVTTLTLERTTVFANRSLGQGGGGGIANGPGDTVNLRNSSVTHNYAQVGTAGGISNDAAGTVTLTATPVVENFPSNCAPTVVPGCAF
ncbi:hypothetical protein ACGFYU_13215 [Streptomyces sp. NPDC048337]|uniref:hypothetical protein n=1 Tax=Streptomyces sp. NPDC048337 TaxID=3365535 RepID=UPI0037207DE3